MTINEAIKNIKELLKWYLKEEPMSETVYKREAVEMAIKALEAQRWIPKNATNGDMIISLYPNLKYYVKGDRIMTTIGVASSFDLEWWNAPYREEGEE